jgi:hypothetical protein
VNDHQTHRLMTCTDASFHHAIEPQMIDAVFIMQREDYRQIILENTTKLFKSGKESSRHLREPCRHSSQRKCTRRCSCSLHFPNEHLPPHLLLPARLLPHPFPEMPAQTPSNKHKGSIQRIECSLYLIL